MTWNFFKLTRTFKVTLNILNKPRVLNDFELFKNNPI